MCRYPWAVLVNAHDINRRLLLLALTRVSIHVIPFHPRNYLSRVVLLATELAKEGIPLPFGNKFWASNWPTGKAPLPGLVLHFIPSVST